MRTQKDPLKRKKEKLIQKQSYVRHKRDKTEGWPWPAMACSKTRVEFITETITIYESNYLVCHQFSLARRGSLETGQKLLRICRRPEWPGKKRWQQLQMWFCHDDFNIDISVRRQNDFRGSLVIAEITWIDEVDLKLFNLELSCVNYCVPLVFLRLLFRSFKS